MDSLFCLSGLRSVKSILQKREIALSSQKAEFLVYKICPCCLHADLDADDKAKQQHTTRTILWFVLNNRSMKSRKLRKAKF